MPEREPEPDEVSSNGAAMHGSNGQSPAQAGTHSGGPRLTGAPPAGENTLFTSAVAGPRAGGFSPMSGWPGAQNGGSAQATTADLDVTPTMARPPVPAPQATRGPDDQPTQVISAVPATTRYVNPPPGTGVPGGQPPTGSDPSDSGASPARTPRALIIAGAVVGLLMLLYIADLLFSLNTVPRGVTVTGVAIGGLDLSAAEQRLRSELEPRTARPIQVTAGEVRSELDPGAAGLKVDWRATLERADSQPLNPLTRIASFFTEREIGIATDADMDALNGALEQLAPIVDRQPAEGTVAFQGVTPTPVDPVAGQQLELAPAAAVLQRDWVSGAPVALPLTPLPPLTTHADVLAAIEKVAQPAVSAPVTVVGEAGTQGTITPEVTAGALSFRAEPARGLVPEINTVAVADALRPQLAASEQPGRDATLDFGSGAPVVVPSQDGRGIDYEVTLKDLLPVLTATGPRQIVAVYAEQPAKLTTDALKTLGITGVISEFSTAGFAADSGLNIKRAAEQINGKILQPGETFSLNATTNPRDAAHGYVEAGIIEKGHASRGIGGGVSQVATTTYNAAYFAGMTDIAHKEHSFYISRYPAAREATVFDNIIDLKFRNDNPTGVLIQTVWTPQTLTVRIYGTKRYEVTSTPGPRTNPTNPTTITIPPGEPCSPSPGAPGFTTTDTRTLREISTGQTRSETRTVRYNPSPIVMCGK